MAIGLDTGFFIELLKDNVQAKEVWHKLIEGIEESALVSSLTLFELERLSLKGKLKKEAFDTLSEAIYGICRIGWISDKESLSLAAKLSHGLGMPSVDALILSYFVLGKAGEIYTTDSHFQMYRKKGIRVINLKE